MISDFHDAARELTQRQKQLDLDDLNNEMADRETGRNSRFRNKEHANSEAAQRRKAHAQTQLSALDALLLNDPEYAKLYNDTMDLLAEAEQAVESALSQAEKALKQSSNELANMLDNASQHPDGRRVFMDENGQVWTEDNELLSPKEAESIVWKEGSPSHTEYQKQKQLHKGNQEHYDDLYDSRYNVLGDIRNHMEDENNPMDKNDIRDIQDTLLEHKNRATEYKTELNQESNAPKSDITAELEIPELK